MMVLSSIVLVRLFWGSVLLLVVGVEQAHSRSVSSSIDDLPSIVSERKSPQDVNGDGTSYGSSSSNKINDKEKVGREHDISILNGPFTLQIGRIDARSNSAEEEIARCDKLVGCAGITLQKDHSDKIKVLAHNFIPLDIGADQQSSKEQVDDGHASDKSDDTGNWRTYRSKKRFVFHKGKLLSDDAGSTRTEFLLSLDEAKSYCQDDPTCVGFTFPVESTHLESAENVTFLSSISDLDRQEINLNQWRSYISNDPDRAVNIAYENIEIHHNELFMPWVSQNCCTRKDPQPTLEELERADQILERVPCNISREEFRARYETPRVPVALIGCDVEWPAAQQWTPQQLMQRFANETTFVGKFHDKRVDPDNYESLGWIANAMATGHDYYVFDNLLSNPDVFSLRDDFSIPGPIENIYNYYKDFPPGYGPSRWFTFGGPGTGTWPHSDPIAADAWNYLAHGHKWWVLYPRGLIKRYRDLYCDDSCSVDMWNTAHWFATVGINAARNEYDGIDKRKRPVHVLQKPGETLYVPNGMVHAVMNLDHSIAVAAHFASTQNLEHVWHKIVNLGAEKHWMQAYYGGILDRDQRRVVRDSSDSWPPIAGDMYFFDGPFLRPEKRLGEDDEEYGDWDEDEDEDSNDWDEQDLEEDDGEWGDEDWEEDEDLEYN